MLIAPVCHSDGAGGAERYLNLLYPRLAGLGHRAHLIGNVPGWPLSQTSVAFSPKWSRRSSPSDFLHLISERRAVAAAADALGPDLFHLQFKREQIGLTGVLGRRAPVVWTEHGRFPGGRYQPLLAAGYRHAARHIAAIICVSGAVSEQMRSITRGSVRIETVRNAVDTSVLRPPSADERRAAREQLEVASDARVVAWVGRLAEGKLPQLAARAGALVQGVTLIAGSGPLLEPLRAQFDGPAVRVLGRLEDPGVVYRAADVFLFTSGGAGEGFPYSALEAAAHDLPVVVNAGSGVGGELSGAAVTVAQDTPEALARALRQAESDGRSRAWAVQHDLAPWAARHAEIFQTL